MTKGKAPQYIRHRREPKNRKHPNTNKRWWTLPLELFSLFAAILGVFAAIVTFLPKLSLDVSGSLRHHDPFGTVFYLKNDGVLSVYDINVGCGIKNLELQGGGGINGRSFGPDGLVIYFGEESRAATLSPGHHMTLPCARTVEDKSPPATKAELVVIATYRPPWVWWHHTDRFPLRVELSDDGTWEWFQIAH